MATPLFWVFLIDLLAALFVVAWLVRRQTPQVDDKLKRAGQSPEDENDPIEAARSAVGRSAWRRISGL